MAPQVGGATAADGTRVTADQQLDGAPSVLYDAVAILCSQHAADRLAHTPAARDFVSDAYAHHKYIAHTAETDILFAASGLTELKDEGFVALGDGTSAEAFITRCRKLRYWRNT